MTEANMSDESDKTVEDLGEFSKYLQDKPSNSISPNRNLKVNLSLAHSQSSHESTIKKSLSSLKDR